MQSLLNYLFIIIDDDLPLLYFALQLLLHLYSISLQLSHRGLEIALTAIFQQNDVNFPDRFQDPWALIAQLFDDIVKTNTVNK